MLVVKSDVEARLNRALTANEEAVFNSVNPALQYLLEEMIGSKLEGTSETTRKYDGGVQHLPIDPCTDVVSVKLVDDYDNVTYTYPTSDYQIEPVNDTLKRMIRFRTTSVTGLNNISILAKFSIQGDADKLAIVKEAMIQALASEVQNSDNIKKETIEGYSIEYATTETKNALKSVEFLFPQL